MNKFLREDQRKAIIDAMIGLPDGWVVPLGFEVSVSVVDHLDSCYQLGEPLNSDYSSCENTRRCSRRVYSFENHHKVVSIKTGCTLYICDHCYKKWGPKADIHPSIQQRQYRYGA